MSHIDNPLNQIGTPQREARTRINRLQLSCQDAYPGNWSAESNQELLAMQREVDVIIGEALECYDDDAIEEEELAAFGLVLELFNHATVVGSVRISNGRIEGICFGKLDASASIRLPADAVLAPGFIDIQVNGGGGVLLNDQPTEAGVQRIIEAHRRGGTTGCLPTLITDRSEVLEQLAAVAQACLMISRCAGFPS